MKYNDDNTIHISAQTKFTEVDVKSLYSHRDLIFEFVKRNFKVQYKQTVLGPLWLFIAPLLTGLMFTVIFGRFIGAGTDDVPHFLFYLSSISMWTLFSSGVTSISSTFLSNSFVFGKIYFPRLTVPIAQMINTLINFAIQFAVFLLFYIVYIIGNGMFSTRLGIMELGFLIMLVLQTALLAFGIGLIITSLTIKYRDLSMAIGFGIQLWMYATPIVYPVSSVTDGLRILLLINPMTSIVSNFRRILFGAGDMLWWAWGGATLTTVVLVIWGVLLYNRTEKTFMDTI